MKGFEWQLRVEAQSDTEPFHRDDPHATVQRVVNQIISVNSKHNGYAACVAA